MVCSLAICMAACQFDRNLIKENAGKDLHIIRYDRMVDDYVNTGNVALWQRMNTEFPRETRALIEDVLHLGRADNEDIDDSLIAYYKDPILVQLRMDISRKFEDLSVYEKALSRAFKRLEAEDKNFVTPKIYAQNSAFNQSIVVGDSLIGISLDKYMGADYPAYKKYFYENQRHNGALAHCAGLLILLPEPTVSSHETAHTPHFGTVAYTPRQNCLGGGTAH